MTELISIELLKKVAEELSQPDSIRMGDEFSEQKSPVGSLDNLTRTLAGIPEETPQEVAKLKSALSFLNADAKRGSGRLFDDAGNPIDDYWLGVVWGIRSLRWTCGESIAREWSQSITRAPYSEDGFKRHWNSYNAAHPRPVTVGSIYLLAKSKGWDGQTTHTSVPLQLPFIRNKRPLQVEENLRAVLNQHRVVVRYNQIAKDCEVLIPGFACVADESSNASMAKVTDLAIKAGMTSARILELVVSLAAQNVYCPVQTYIGSKAWDGSNRFQQFVGQLVIKKKAQVAHVLIRKWLIQAVAAVYEPEGIANAGVIVMTGSQGLGKSRLFKDLASGVERAFLEGATLDPENRDSVMAAVRHWIVELGEIDATFKRSDLAQLKAFITRQEDLLRRPYAKQESRFPRRTVFAGTVNDHSFLHDLTGNRRFWPIEVQSINRDSTIDYQQLWAEVKTWYDARETWYLSAQESRILDRYSEDYLVHDPVVEALLAHFDFRNASAWIPLTMREICDKIGFDKITKHQQMQLASAIKKYNGNQPPRKKNGIKRHIVPA
jgi:hypothetical protein